MIPELGHFALILALCCALVQAVVPMAGSFSGRGRWLLYGEPAVTGQFLFLLFSFACLATAFLQNDFSVAYVAQNSNSRLPDIYKFAAVWGAHEGSLLLWVLMLAGWSFAVVLCGRNLPPVLRARVLSVLGMVSIGFLLFMLLTSNPFERTFPNPPLDGQDLNPLLQDPGLVVHPPLLYMGYVGFSVAFAFAIAALLGGRLDAAWARWSRPWTNTAWAFLTGGIVLGSWWAYYELGWGGWWFWDPVENASFMPWLVGTALVHSLAATEKRGVFKSWTVLLAIFAFSLSLLGTFLVRSGVLTSVHAFASDPSRGVFILALLLIVIGGSLTLYAFRAPSVQSYGRFGLLSRETLLLVNNVVLIVAALTVLIGTLFPLFVDLMGGEKVSVGPPYFNAVFAPLMVILAVFLGLGPLMRWKRSPPELLRRVALVPLALAVFAGLVFPFAYAGEFHAGAALAVALGTWIFLMTARAAWHQVAHREQRLSGLLRQGPSFHAMLLAHTGFAVALIGVSLTSIYSEERDLRMGPGDREVVAGYEFLFEGTHHSEGPNFVADRGTVRIFRDGQPVAELYPEKRSYPVQQNTMTEAGIDAGLLRDLFVALGEPLGQGFWAVRIQVKPFVRWIWYGGLFMSVAGVLTALDRRYRRRRESAVASPAGQPGELGA